MTLTEAAYVAGVVDGEGYISSSRYELHVTNTDLSLLHRVRDIAGCGRLYRPGKPLRREHRPQYRWRLTKRGDIVKLLRRIQPFLTAKAPACQSFLSRCASSPSLR